MSLEAFLRMTMGNPTLPHRKASKFVEDLHVSLVRDILKDSLSTM